MVHTQDDLMNDDLFPNFIIKNDPFERTMDKVNNKKRDIDRQSLDIDNKHQKLMSEPVQNEQKIHDYPMIKTTLGEFRKDEMKMSNDKLRHKKSFYKLFETRLENIPGKRETVSISIDVIIKEINKPFYSCLLSDPAYEWQRGCRLYGPRCFYHVNCVVVMLTGLHLHKKRITGSLAAIHRPGH